MLALFVIVMRLFFRILLGGAQGETVLFTLPSIPLPDWAAGIQLGGVVTAEAVLTTLYESLRLAVMLLCIGAANALANPRQALRSVPAALYEASTAVVIALSVAPQLIESIQRVRRARRLRGDSTTSLRSMGTIAMPVLADAIERSLSLAAGMESRGFARTSGLPTKGTLPVMLVSSMAATLGVFLLLSTDFWQLSLGLMLLGMLGAGLGLRAAGARLRVTTYRPHPWRSTETLVALSGALVALIVLGLGWIDPNTLSPALLALLDPAALTPSTDPLVWPSVPPVMLFVVALVLAPLPLTRPRPPATVESTRNDTRVRVLRPRTHAEPEPTWR